MYLLSSHVLLGGQYRLIMSLQPEYLPQLHVHYIVNIDRPARHISIIKKQLLLGAAMGIMLKIYGSIPNSFRNALGYKCTKLHACITNWTIPLSFGASLTIFGKKTDWKVYQTFLSWFLSNFSCRIYFCNLHFCIVHS